MLELEVLEVFFVFLTFFFLAFFLGFAPVLPRAFLATLVPEAVVAFALLLVFFLVALDATRFFLALDFLAAVAVDAESAQLLVFFLTLFFLALAASSTELATI